MRSVALAGLQTALPSFGVEDETVLPDGLEVPSPGYEMHAKVGTPLRVPRKLSAEKSADAADAYDRQFHVCDSSGSLGTDAAPQDRSGQEDLPAPVSSISRGSGGRKQDIVTVDVPVPAFDVALRAAMNSQGISAGPGRHTAIPDSPRNEFKITLTNAQGPISWTEIFSRAK
jgi:hypothetical protein